MSAPGIKEIALVLFVLSVLTSCGQKGDLYHPEEQQSALTVTGTHA